MRGQRLLYEVGSTRRHRGLAVVAPRDLHQSTFLAVEAMRDQGYGENRGSRRASALGQVHVSSAGQRWLEALAGAYTARFGEPGVTPLADVTRGALGLYDSYSDDTEGTSSRILSALRLHDQGVTGHGAAWRLDAGAHMQWRRLELVENFTGFLLYPDAGDRRRQAHESLSGGVTLRGERDLAVRWTAVAGAGGLVDSMRQQEQQELASGVPWQHNRMLDAWQAAAHAYLGIRGAPAPDVIVRAGARADGFLFSAADALAAISDAARDTMAALSPRLSVAWRVTPAWALFAALGRGLRPPEARTVTAMAEDMAAEADRDARHYRGGAPRIATSSAAELGARWRPDRRLSMGGGAFATWLGSELLFDHVSGVVVELGGTRRLGLELEVAWMPAEWLRLHMDMTIADVRFAISADPVPAAPRFLATAEARLEPARMPWRVGAQLRYLAARPLAHGAIAAPVAVLDVTGAYRGAGWEIGIQIDNALGARWREGEYHFAYWFDRDRPRSQIPRVHYSPGRPLGARLSFTGWL